MSEGEYVTLGFYERDDLAEVVKHLRDSGEVSTLGLWGRSMGAATALLHGDRDPSIAGMVVDSSFSDLETLAWELVDTARKQGHSIPGIAVSAALSMVKGTVKKKAKLEFKDLKPIAHVDKCFIPVLFAHAQDDIFIQPHHSEDLHTKYAGEKKIVSMDGDHNTPRPQFFLDSAGIFIAQALQVPPELMLDPTNISMNRLPWHQARGGTRHPWACAACTFVNAGGELTCSVCGAFEPGTRQMVVDHYGEESYGGQEVYGASGSPVGPPAEPQDPWTCQACTFENISGASCQMCGTLKPAHDEDAAQDAGEPATEEANHESAPGHESPPIDAGESAEK